jgi:hypothetical protein
VTTALVACLAVALSVTAAPELAGQVAGAPTAMRDGLILEAIESPKPDGGREYEFVVRRTNVSAREVRFRLPTPPHAVTAVRIHSGNTGSIVGRFADGTSSLNVVDLTTGQILFAKTCRELRLVRQDEKYFCEEPSGVAVSYQTLTRTERRAMHGGGATEILTNGSLPAKRKFLSLMRGSSSLRNDAAAGRAVAEAVVHAVGEDMADAEQRPAVGGLRKGSPRRDYMGELLTTAAYLRERSILPYLVRADHPVVPGALSWFGAEAIKLAVPAVRAQRPVGYSKYYRRYLLEGISLVLRREPGLVATLSEDVGKLGVDRHWS